MVHAYGLTASSTAAVAIGAGSFAVFSWLLVPRRIACAPSVPPSASASPTRAWRVVRGESGTFTLEEVRSARWIEVPGRFARSFEVDRPRGAQGERSRRWMGVPLRTRTIALEPRPEVTVASVERASTPWWGIPPGLFVLALAIPVLWVPQEARGLGAGPSAGERIRTESAGRSMVDRLRVALLDPRTGKPLLAMSLHRHTDAVLLAREIRGLIRR